MPQILELPINPGTLDPETLRVVSAAYDMVIGGWSGRVSLEEREEVASRLIGAAMDGQRDFSRLCKLAREGLTV